MEYHTLVHLNRACDSEDCSVVSDTKKQDHLSCMLLSCAALDKTWKISIRAKLYSIVLIIAVLNHLSKYSMFGCVTVNV